LRGNRRRERRGPAGDGRVKAYRRLRFVFGREVSVIVLHTTEAALLDCDWRRLPPEVEARLDREGRR
jgi:DNA transformation protein